MRPRRIYIAGPMTGIPELNFPAFDDAKRVLKSHGWEPVSPADIDREEFGIRPEGMTGNEGLSPETTRRIAIRDIRAVSECEAIYLLDGWRGSLGALAELAFAEWMGLEIIFQIDADAADFFGDTVEQADGILQTAIEITSGDRRRDYDKATPNHVRIARLWNAYLDSRKNPKTEITPSDAAFMMILLKIARGAYTPTRDTAVDIAGYARCWAQINGFEGE